MPAPDQPGAREWNPDVQNVADLRRAGAFNLYVLNHDFQVILSSVDDSDAALDLFSPAPQHQEPGIQEPLNPLIRDLVEQVRGPTNIHRLTALVKHDIAASVSLLEGSAGKYIAVLLERVRMRDAISRARERYGLSPRESEVVELIIKGSSTTDIASTLKITEATVHEHVRNIARKTNARNRPDIVAHVLAGK